LREARGEIIVRLDAHSVPYPEYVERCVSDLEASLGENVGGIWEIRPGSDTFIAQAISVAAAHPLGVGDALYRHTQKAAQVDTVPFGAFRRELLALVGFFDESLLANEDYEFNARIRKSGGKIWLDPSIRSIYYARSTLGGLAKQYYNYGYWKWRMVRRYPDTLRWRQFLPPAFVLSLFGLGLLGFIWNGFWILFWVDVGVYWLALIIAGIQASLEKKKSFLIYGLPLAISSMHICWGTGFLWSMIKGIFTIQKPEKK
jgi:succinoglycan biosynthesis protein ExoA